MKESETDIQIVRSLRVHVSFEFIALSLSPHINLSSWITISLRKEVLIASNSILYFFFLFIYL